MNMADDSDKWFRIRRGVMVVVFLYVLLMSFVPVDHAATPTWGWKTSATWLLFLALIPLGLLVVIGVQAVNPLSDVKWTIPTQRSNPFHFGNPLLFFHFWLFRRICG